MSSELCRKVAVGIVINSDREILISQRRSTSSLAGYWEFPGGKCEQDESPEKALVRELNEEVGLKPVAYTLFYEKTHKYSKDMVHLFFYWVTDFEGDAKSCEQQQIKWASVTSLASHQFPEGNADVLTRIQSLFA